MLDLFIWFNVIFGGFTTLLYCGLLSIDEDVLKLSYKNKKVKILVALLVWPYTLFLIAHS